MSVFNDGSRKELINLQGTIPVAYKGNFFEIKSLDDTIHSLDLLVDIFFTMQVPITTFQYAYG